MATMNSTKNFALSPAGADLGLGDMLKTQVEDQENERKKKLLQQSRATSLGPATSSFMSAVGSGGGGNGY